MNQQISSIIAGIDLGTTYSEIAVYRDGRPLVIGDKLPSCVGLDGQGHIIVGDIARNQAIVHPDRVVRSIKRNMGQVTTVRMGNKDMTPQDVSAEILKTLKLRAETFLQVPIHRAVITVPAYFNDAARRATREAGEQAGWIVERILHEPTAAALCYHDSHETARTILVYDLGGGTFDVSILKLQHGVIEVLASHGDTRLGGDDFDAQIVEHLKQVFKNEHGYAAADDAITAARMSDAAERAKIALSSRPYETIRLELLPDQTGVKRNFEYEFSREEFNSLICPWIDKTIDSIDHALKDAGLLARDIDSVILAGGSSRIPYVIDMLESIFSGKIGHSVDPDLCVAMGASIEGAILSGEDPDKLLLEITPHSIGIEATVHNEFGQKIPGVFSRVIRRGTKIPISASEVYYTAFDDQQCVHFKVYQGENERAAKNWFLGDFMVEGLSPGPAGNPLIFSLHLDFDGLLTATAMEKSTGLSRRIVIEDALGSNTEHRFKPPSRVPDSLRGLRHPKPHSSSPSWKTEIQELIQKAEAILGKIPLPERDREDVQELIDALNKEVETHDSKADTVESATVRSLRKELSDVLFYLE
jgi:molecular chaperone DnaK